MKKDMRLGIVAGIVVLLMIGITFYESGQPLSPDQYKNERYGWYTQMQNIQSQLDADIQSYNDGNASLDTTMNELGALQTQSDNIISELKGTHAPNCYETVHNLDIDVSLHQNNAIGCFILGISEDNTSSSDYIAQENKKIKQDCFDYAQKQEVFTTKCANESRDELNAIDDEGK